jgi:hypothetical protein
MRTAWGTWISDHSKAFVDVGAGVGKTKRVTAKGSSDARNDVMLYCIVEADSHTAAAKMFESHPHLGIPQSSIEIMDQESSVSDGTLGQTLERAPSGVMSLRRTISCPVEATGCRLQHPEFQQWSMQA